MNRFLSSEWLRPKMPRVDGYFQLFGRYIAWRFLLAIMMGILVLGFIYILAAHPYVTRLWYLNQDRPEFMVDSPNLAGYSGQVRLLNPDGALLYEGPINKTVIEGEGKLYHNGVLIYQGEFLAGEYSGQGSLFTEEGFLLYRGEFAANLYHGQGELYGEEAGVVYSGEFANGLFEGKGTLHYVLDEIAYVYKGEFKEGAQWGQGQLFSGETLLYDGSFVAGVYEGEGRLYQQGRLLYAGGFAAGLYEGDGKLYEKGSLLYKGEFVAGLYDGEGVEYNPATGFKAFEGKYLEGKRMAAGTVFDEKGAALAALPQLLDPVALLGWSYDDTCLALSQAGITGRLLPQLSGYQPLVDEQSGVIYVFALAGGDKPGRLEQVYLCGLSATNNIVVGANTGSVRLPVQGAEAPGKTTEPLATVSLALSNTYWSRNAELSQVGRVSYRGDGVQVTAYYLPTAGSTPVTPSGGSTAETTGSGSGTTSVGTPNTGLRVYSEGTTRAIPGVPTDSSSVGGSSATSNDASGGGPVYYLPAPGSGSGATTRETRDTEQYSRLSQLSAMGMETGRSGSSNQPDTAESSPQATATAQAAQPGGTILFLKVSAAGGGR